MEMKVDRVLLKLERQKRAWSQEHLANVSGLGLRTIQRIERGGVASYDSVQALAAVFSVHVEDLAVISKKRGERFSIGKVATGLVAMTMVATTVGLYSKNSLAEQVLLDVGVSKNNAEMTNGQLLTAEGKEAEIRLSDGVRVVIVPTIQDDGKVFLSVRIYEDVNGESLLISEPKLITADNKEAEIRLEGDSGDSLRVLVTPHTSN